MSSPIKFNLNDYVSFKPCREGNEVLSDNFPRGIPERYQPDENGYVKMQGWQFMQIFGPHINMGFAPIIETEILIHTFL